MKKTFEQKIEDQLWDLICGGAGDGDTIRALAKKIARMAKREAKKEQTNDH